MLCDIEREIIGSIARFRVTGRFEGTCAFNLAHRIEVEPLGELTLDFSQCAEFVDYGIAVLSSALLSVPGKRVHLEGLRQHQLRLFKYFGVDADELLQRETTAPAPQRTVPELPSEISEGAKLFSATSPCGESGELSSPLLLSSKLS